MPRGVYTRKRVVRPTDRPTDRVVSVNAIDYPALLAQLEQQRAASVQEIADLDVIIAAVRQRAGHVVPVLPPARRPGPQRGTGANQHTSGGNGKRANQHVKTIAPDAARAQARPLYERGDSVAAVAKAVGRSEGTVYSWASTGAWKRPKGHAAEPGAAPVPDDRTKLAGSVRCTNPECGVYTDYDPCTKCGKKLKRKGW